MSPLDDAPHGSAVDTRIAFRAGRSAAVAHSGRKAASSTCAAITVALGPRAARRLSRPHVLMCFDCSALPHNQFRFLQPR